MWRSMYVVCCEYAVEAPGYWLCIVRSFPLGTLVVPYSWATISFFPLHFPQPVKMVGGAITFFFVLFFFQLHFVPDMQIIDTVSRRPDFLQDGSPLMMSDHIVMHSDKKTLEEMSFGHCDLPSGYRLVVVMNPRPPVPVPWHRIRIGSYPRVFDLISDNINHHL